MEALAYVAIAIVFIFGLVVFFGAPYLPTLKPQIDTALDLMDLKPGQLMLEIGSGDGSVMIAAAQRGWKVVGYEINPILCLITWLRTRKVRQNVKIIWGDAWQKDWPEADGIYIFGLDKLMPKLHKKVMRTQTKPVKLVSFAFRLPQIAPVRSKDGVFLYQYGVRKKHNLQSA